MQQAESTSANLDPVLPEVDKMLETRDAPVHEDQRPRPVPKVCAIYLLRHITIDILLRYPVSLRIPYQGSLALGPRPL